MSGTRIRKDIITDATHAYAACLERIAALWSARPDGDEKRCMLARIKDLASEVKDALDFHSEPPALGDGDLNFLVRILEMDGGYPGLCSELRDLS